VTDGDIRGWIFDIQRFSIHDGPGIRTTVFLKGCPLRCVWCHNPEGMGPEPVLSFVPAKCIGCGYCVRVCPNGAHRMDPEEGHVLDRELCRVCGSCTEECYAEALELVGREATVDEVIDEVLRDRSFYETSGGGMTLSGGEPMTQTDFTEVLLRRAKQERLHTCVDTCGYCDFSCFQRILKYVDLFLYDVKDMDDARHREFTGVPNGLVLDNVEALHRSGARILLRLPIIPGYNDRQDHFERVAMLARRLGDIEGVEILPYHKLGTSKLERLGLPDAMPRRPEPVDEDRMALWISALRERGVNVVNRIEGAQQPRVRNA